MRGVGRLPALLLRLPVQLFVSSAAQMMFEEVDAGGDEEEDEERRQSGHADEQRRHGSHWSKAVGMKRGIGL